MTAVYRQPKRKSAHLISELHGVSQDEIILTGGSFVSGEVLGLSADGSKYVKLNLDAGAEFGGVAKAVLFGCVNATDADKAGLAHARVCAVDGKNLVWPEGIADVRKAEFIAELSALNIVVR